uniref:S24 family peptidase n=1 Tax=Streptomyces chartreusis TaxID=1969 RepID=UPI003F490AB0
MCHPRGPKDIAQKVATRLRPRPPGGHAQAFALKNRQTHNFGALRAPGAPSGEPAKIRKRGPSCPRPNGDTVIAMPDGETTVQRFKRKDGHAWLLPHDLAYEPNHSCGQSDGLKHFDLEGLAVPVDASPRSRVKSWCKANASRPGSPGNVSRDRLAPPQRCLWKPPNSSPATLTRPHGQYGARRTS